MSDGELHVLYGRCQQCAAQNPAAAPPLAAIVATYEELGRAVAVGELADRLGLPDGARLVESVADFVGSSPTLLRTVAETGGLARLSYETGGIATAVAETLGTQARKVWAVVESAAAKSWRALERAPTKLLLVGSGLLLASQYLDSGEEERLAEIAAETAVVQDAVMALPPERRLAALKEAGFVSGSGGLGTLGWLAVIAVVGLGGYAAWRAATR